MELFETGKKGLAEIQNTLERIVDCDPGDCRLGRIDLTADVRDVSLPWFREHTFVSVQAVSLCPREGDGRGRILGDGEEGVSDSLLWQKAVMHPHLRQSRGAYGALRTVETPSDPRDEEIMAGTGPCWTALVARVSEPAGVAGH